MNCSVKFLEPTLSVCAKPRRRTGMAAVALPRDLIVPPCRRGRARRHSGRMILIESIVAPPPCVHRRIARAPIRDAAIEDGRNGALEIGGISNANGAMAEASRSPP